MRMKKLGAALFVVAALVGVLASSALAASMTEDVKWFTGSGSGTELSGSETVSAEQIGTGTITTRVSGTEILVHFTGTECIECRIENSGGVAVGSGKLKLTGVTVEKPANCTTLASIETKALSDQDDWAKSVVVEGETMIVEPTYVKAVPTQGEEAGFASFSLTGEKCPLKTTIIPKGSLFSQAVAKSGELLVNQQVSSSEAINAEAGGSFHVGTESAALTSTIRLALSGAKKGQAFGTHK